MRNAVGVVFFAFSTKFEGSVPFFYLDVKGLVTIGIGNLVDPIELAVGLLMARPDGTFATWEEIEEAWHVVKGRQDLKLAGGGHFADVLTKAGLAELRLTREALEDLVRRKLASVDAQLAKRFPGYAKAPADAQLGLISMAWAAGAAFRAPKFERAFNDSDFATCAAECHFDDAHNPGLRPRNVANAKLFANAAIVIAERLDPSVLYYPDDPSSAAEGGGPPTLPEGPAAA